MHPDAIIGKWIEFLLKKFIVIFIKVLRSSSGAFYYRAAWTHAKLASEELMNILKINEHEYVITHSWYSYKVISDCKRIMQN